MPKDTVNEINKVLGRGEPQQQQHTQIDLSIKDEAEKIVADLEIQFPEKFIFNTDREAYMCIGAREVIDYLKRTYLKDKEK